MVFVFWAHNPNFIITNVLLIIVSKIWPCYVQCNRCLIYMNNNIRPPYLCVSHQLTKFTYQLLSRDAKNRVIHFLPSPLLKATQYPNVKHYRQLRTTVTPTLRSASCSWLEEKGVTSHKQASRKGWWLWRRWKVWLGTRTYRSCLQIDWLTLI